MGFLDMLFGKPKQVVKAPSQEEVYVYLCNQFGKTPYCDIAYFIYTPSNQYFDKVAIFQDDCIYVIDGIDGQSKKAYVYDIANWRTHTKTVSGVTFTVLSTELKDGSVFEISLSPADGEKLLHCLQEMWKFPYVEREEDTAEDLYNQIENRENTFCAASGIDPATLYPLEKRLNAMQKQ